MLKRIYRLPARIRLNHPKTVVSDIVLLKVSANNLSHNRFGFTISKKTAKSAVDRNRTKRLVRSCVEDVFIRLTPGFDYLFIIRKNLADMSRETICEGIIKLLNIKK